MKAVTIFLKELTDILRDQRSLFSGLAYVLFGPIVVMVAINMLAAQSRDEALAPIALCGKGEAPDLVGYLAASGLTFDPAAKICLDIPADFGARLKDGRTARVAILADLATAGVTVRRLERAVQSYAANIASQRLMTRGVAPAVRTPIDIDTQSTNAVSRQADMVARILIIFLVSAPFFVCLAAAADMTAGERERRALEPLLAHPVGAFSIVLGKWLAVSALGVAGTAACVIGGLLLLGMSALPELGVRLETSFNAAMHVVMWLMPMTLLVAAAHLAIGLWSKSFKDAQSYLTLMSFVPVIAGFAISGERLTQVGLWPLAWELNALAAPLLGSTTLVAPFGQLAAIELGAAFALLLLSAQRLRSEAILSQG